MRLINYRCDTCGMECEILLNSGEEPKGDGTPCWSGADKNDQGCTGRMKQFNFKNNKHRVRIFDK